MIIWKKIEKFAAKKGFIQATHQFFVTTLLIYRFFLSFLNFNWFSAILLVIILIQIAIMLFIRSLQQKLKSHYAFISILSALIHIGTIYRIPNRDWQFFHGMESIIVINLNFQTIKNEFWRCTILAIILIASFLKFNDFESSYGELFFFFYCFFILEFSMKFKKDLWFLKKSNLRIKKTLKRNETKKVFKKSEIIKTFNNNPNKNSKKNELPHLIKEFSEKDILDPLGLGLIIIDHNLKIFYSNEILFKLCKSQNLEEAKIFFLSIQENKEMKKSNFWKIPEIGIQRISKQTMQIQKTLDNSENSIIKKNSSSESFGRISKNEKTESIVSKEDIQFKCWKKTELSIHLNQDSYHLKKDSCGLKTENLHPQSVLNYLERIFEYYKLKTGSYRKDNSIRDEESNQFSMYAECKTGDEKSFQILISFIPLEKKIDTDLYCEILITFRKLSELEIKYFEEGKTKHKVLGSFCHELRTPLNGLINMLDLMQSYTEELNLPDENFNQNFTELLTSAVISSHLLLNEIDDFIDYFSYHNEILEIHPGPFDLQQSFQDVHRIFSYISKKKNINLIIEIDENIPTIIYNDHQKLRQIIFNLLSIF